MSSKAGYEIGRNDEGLTARDREVIREITSPRTMSEVGARLGMTRQRVSEIAKRLAERGHLVKVNGKYVRPEGDRGE